MSQTIKKSVALKDLAQMADVSIATVSMALAGHPGVNDDTRRKIRELSRQAGYRRPQRTSRPKAARMAIAKLASRFGFILLGSRLEDETQLNMLHALTVAAADIGARMEVRAVEDASDGQAGIETALAFARELDGLVLSGFVQRELLEELELAGAPFVVCGHAMAEMHEVNLRYGQVVAANEVAMGELATRHLLSGGHKRIGFVCERLPSGLWSDRWLRGYRLALLEAGIHADPRWVHISNKVYAGAAPAVEALAQLTDPPTAYVIPDARVAASLRDEWQARGMPLADDAVVIGAIRSMADRYGVADHPWIGYDTDQLAAVIVRQLRQLCIEPMSCTTELIVPFATRNLSDPLATFRSTLDRIKT